MSRTSGQVTTAPTAASPRCTRSGTAKVPPTACGHPNTRPADAMRDQGGHPYLPGSSCLLQPTGPCARRLRPAASSSTLIPPATRLDERLHGSAGWPEPDNLLVRKSHERLMFAISPQTRRLRFARWTDALWSLQRAQSPVVVPGRLRPLTSGNHGIVRANSLPPTAGYDDATCPEPSGRRSRARTK